MVVDNVANNGIADFRLPPFRNNLPSIVRKSLTILEKAIGPSDIDQDYNSVMDIFETLDRIAISNNERLILSKPYLAVYLLNTALDSGKRISDRGGIAHYMYRNAKNLVFGYRDSPNLVSICIQKLLDDNLFKTILKDDDNNDLDLVKATLDHLKQKGLDVSDQNVEKTILAAYRKMVKYGFLPHYVDLYLDEINAGEEERTPEFKEAMIQNLLNNGLSPDQYGSDEEPWSDDISNIKNAVSEKIDILSTELNQTINTKEEQINTSITSVDDKINAFNRIEIGNTSYTFKGFVDLLNLKFESVEKQILMLKERRVIEQEDFQDMSSTQFKELKKNKINTLGDIIHNQDKFREILENMGQIDPDDISKWIEKAEAIINSNVMIKNPSSDVKID